MNSPSQTRSSQSLPQSLPTPPPRLTLSHATMAVDDLDTMLTFYCEVLGFQVTNRGLEGLPEFRPIEKCRQDFADQLDGRTDG